MHVPLNVDALRDVMPVFFELLALEPEASVRAVLGHFVFVYIHPYMDGNGRMGRFLMNAMLASGGYPWTVIPVISFAWSKIVLTASSKHHTYFFFSSIVSILLLGVFARFRVDPGEILPFSSIH